MGWRDPWPRFSVELGPLKVTRFVEWKESILLQAKPRNIVVVQMGTRKRFAQGKSDWGTFFAATVITITVVCARIIVEMGSQPTKSVPVQSPNSFLDQRSEKTVGVISQESFRKEREPCLTGELHCPFPPSCPNEDELLSFAPDW